VLTYVQLDTQSDATNFILPELSNVRNLA